MKAVYIGRRCVVSLGVVFAVGLGVMIRVAGLYAAARGFKDSMMVVERPGPSRTELEPNVESSVVVTCSPILFGEKREC